MEKAAKDRITEAIQILNYHIPKLGEERIILTLFDGTKDFELTLNWKCKIKNVDIVEFKTEKLII